MDRGFTLLSENIEAVESAIRQGTDEIVSTLNWGFSEVLISLGRMNDSLTELVKLARTPSQTWAFEQFEIARDEFRRTLYPEALDSITRAISGHGSNTGYKTDFRFSFLLGTLRLGSYKNSSPEIVDIPRAEEAFLASARYAGTDCAVEAGRALICAGRAAYLQGQFKRAISHFADGLIRVPSDHEGIYQLARAYFADGMLKDASDSLVKAILMDSKHAIIAAGDADFISKKDFIEPSLRTALIGSEERYKRLYHRAIMATQQASGFVYCGVVAHLLVSDRLANVSIEYEATKKLAVTGTLVGFESATKELVSALSTFPSIFEAFRQRFINRNRDNLSTRAEPSPKTPTLPLLSVFCFVGITTFVLLFIGALILCHGAYDNPMCQSTSKVFGQIFIISCVVGVIAVATYLFAHESSESRRSDYYAWQSNMNDEIAVMRDMPCPSVWQPLTNLPW